MINFFKKIFGQSESEEEKYRADKYALALFEEIKCKNIPLARASKWSDEKLNEMTVRMMITRLEILDDEVVKKEYQQGLAALQRAEKAVE